MSEPVNLKIFPRNEHKISRKDIDPDALKIMYRLHRHGYKAFMVGGGVRDLLLGKKPKDFDIGSDATPNQIRSLFRNCRIIGRRFKLAHIFFHHNKIIEVSTFRDLSEPFDGQDSEEHDIAAQIRRDNKYGTAETDALRRDITINGLFYDIATFSVIDYVGGMKDLREGVVRTIGEPNQRIQEDPVRILRIVRHAVRAGFNIEKACQEAILANKHLLSQCSPMRVYEELKKDLSSGFCAPILKGLADVRVLDELLPVITNGANPLSENQEFMDSLRKLDELQADGGGVSATVPLCLICVFAFESKFVDGRNWLAPELEGELGDLVHDCFLHLAVPRKEKMRIEDTVSLAIRIVNAAEGSKLPKQILKNPALADVIPLLTCLGSPAVELLKGLKYDNSDREGQRDRRRTRGQRYPRRRRFSPTKSQRL